MMEQQSKSSRANVFVLIFLAISGLVLVVMAVVAADLLWQFVGAVIGLALIGVVLFEKFAKSKGELNKARYDFLIAMASKGALPSDGSFRLMHPQIEAPVKETIKPDIDPRHALLVRLVMLTIRSDRYGQTSKRLMTADDAQIERSGTFADRMQWDAASKYGQEIGLLFVQRGGKSDEQGLKIHRGTAADLLEALMERNQILDSAVAALPNGRAA